MTKKIAKYVGLGVVVLLVVLSFGYNAFNFYKAYASALRFEGYTQAMQVLETSLDQLGKVELTKKTPEGKMESVVLVPQASEKTASTKK